MRLHTAVRMLGGSAAVLLAGLAVAGGGGPEPARSPQEWVRQLGSESYRKREEATRRLLHMEEAYGALLRARESSDPEVRRRVAHIIGLLRGKIEEHAAWELLSEVRPGQVERLVGRAVQGRGPAAARDLDEVLRLARKLTARASRVRGHDLRILHGTPAPEVVRDCPPAGLWGKRIVVAGLRHDVASLSNCLLVSGGPLRHVGRVYSSVVLVNGDLAGCSAVQRSLVICRGNVGDVTSIDGSVLLIKGRLGAVVAAEGSVFQARELGRFTSSHNNVFLNRREVAATFREGDRFLQPVEKQ